LISISLGLKRFELSFVLAPGQPRWFRITSAGRFSPLGPLGIVALDLIDGIPGLAECNQNGFGEVHAFLITFRDLVPRCAMSRSRMIDEGSFDGARHNYETVFRHLGSPCFCAKHTTACGRTFYVLIRHRSLASFRFPQCVSLRDGLNAARAVVPLERLNYGNAGVHDEIASLGCPAGLGPGISASPSAQ
jgi:hypothetical protein